MKKISSIIFFLCFIGTIYSQVTYEGPESGSVPTGATVSTDKMGDKNSPNSQIPFRVILHDTPEELEIVILKNIVIIIIVLKQVKNGL